MGGRRPSLVKAGSTSVKAGIRFVGFAVPGEREQLPDAASATEGTQRLEIRDAECDVTARGVRVTELYGSDCGSA